jgi:hypothetical protein
LGAKRKSAERAGLALVPARRSIDDICGKDFNVQNGENQSRGSS